MATSNEVPSWASVICENSTSTSPADILEDLMAAPECAAFGPVHHFLVGAALLASVRNATGSGDLRGQLQELSERSGAVPGGACARWGVCGAAASCGMALSILLGNAPLKAEGWSETQKMVADLLGQIAQAGSPRCCKRDSRVAVRGSVRWFNEVLGVDLRQPTSEPVCAVSSDNVACIGARCPYHS